MPSTQFDDEGRRRPDAEQPQRSLPPIIFLPAGRWEQLRRLSKKIPSDRLATEIFSLIYVRTLQVAQHSGTKR